ncbi:MAG: T9SS type A sorting domain-containing protein [Bacteroidetes bacterium]|nr:T9SS type A sorting domain-containing protein [Bacteroidota bacterium]
MYTCTTCPNFTTKKQKTRRVLLRKACMFALLTVVGLAFQSWDYYQPWSNASAPPMALQPIGAWANLSQAQRTTLQNGGVVTNFNSGICSGVTPILLNISGGPAPSAFDNTTINARQPRRWGNTSFYLANQNMGGAGVQFCFDLSIATSFSMDSREHAYFANGETIGVTASNGGVPVNLAASYQGGPLGNASISGNGTGSVQFSANGKTGGGLWWSVNSSGQPVTQVCIEYFSTPGELPTTEPFRFSIDGTKCVADPALVCNSSAPVSRWGRLGANQGLYLDDGQPVYNFNSGFCDESGDPINFIEITASPSIASGNIDFLNNQPPRPYGRHSFDNSREYVGGGGNTYCFTLDEARPINLNSLEHKFFAAAERVRLTAWLGADPVVLAGFSNGNAPTSNGNGLTFSGFADGKGVAWSASSNSQPVSQVCVEYWRVGGGPLTGEPFTLELCANRCLYDDDYACAQNPGGCSAGFPKIEITKTVTPINEYGLNTCNNPGGNVVFPAYKVSLTMYNSVGAAKELFLIDDLLNYLGSAYVDTLTAPQIVSSNATTLPILNPLYDGRDYTNLFLPYTGWLSAGQSFTVEFTIALDPNAPGALTALCNSAFGGGTTNGGFIVSDLSGDFGGGYSLPTPINNLLPPGVVATPAQDVTMEATLMNYMNAIPAWVDNHGGATFSVPGCSPITWTSDFDMDNWVWNCSYIDGHIDVTFTAHDNCGHTFTTCATFTLVDTQGPSCVKATNLDLDCSDPNAAAELDNWLNYDGNWNDLSQPVTFTHDFMGIPPGSCSGDTITVTWTGTDNCGNTTIFVGYLTVSDNQPPVLQNVPADVTLDPCTALPSAADVTATDACDPSVTVDFDETVTGPYCNQTITRTWTATDDCGNTASASQTIHVVDNQAPVFSNVPADTTAECPNVPPVQDPTVTDCSPFTVVFSEQQVGGACPLANIITRTWIATDTCGHADTVTQTINMTPPNVPSTLIWTYVPPDTTTTCDQNPGFGIALAETTCPAGGLSISFTDVVNSNGDCSQPFSIARTWIAHDACGNMIDTSQTISTGPDTEGPIFASDTPDTITVDCGGPLYQPVAFDNCGATFLDYMDSNETGDCTTGFHFTRTWTATDACGNSTDFVQDVTTNPDTTAPVFIFVPYDQFFDCDDTISFPDPIAFDNCGDVTITYTDSIIGTGDCHFVDSIEYGYDIIRTWTATDECGNSTTATTSAWVLPGFNSGNLIAFSYVPEHLNVDCSGNAVFGQPVCHSACGALTISFVDEITAGDCTSATTIVRHWTATDVCGNTTFAHQTIVIQPDQSAPVFTLASQDLTMTCTSGSTPTFDVPTVTDNCANGANLTISHHDDWSTTNTACANQSVTRTWTATDACGNEATVSQTITIIDNEAPIFSTVPADETLNCGQPVDFGTPDVNDNCSSSGVSYSDEVIDLPCGQQHIRTWTATDACGNSSVAEQKITVTDSEAPSFSNVPADLSLTCGQPVEFGTPDATDGCSTVSLTHSDEQIDLACGQQHIRTWTATDACGNSVVAQQKITVTDNEAPAFSSQPVDQTIECGQPVVFENLTVSDDCSSAAVAFSDLVQPTNCGMNHTRTWTATDACGNITTASQTISEVDTQAPVFEPMPSELTMTLAEFAAWTPPVASATDCNNVTITTESSTASNCETTSHLFTYTATDACGNAASHTLTVTLSDALFEASADIPASLDCGNSYDLTASAVNGNPPYSYAWSVVGGTGWEFTAGADAELATLLAGDGTATLSLQVMDASGCAWLEAFTVSCTETASAVQEKAISGLELLPNPTKDFLAVRYHSSTGGEANMRILNTLGEVVLLRNAQTFTGANTVSFDVSQLAAGTYFLSLQVGDGVVTKRFVKVW